MTDKSTIICYLKGKDSIVLPNFPEDVTWNSKKWRVLLFFSNEKDLIFAGRQYPFFSEAALPIVRTHLLDIFNLRLCTEWLNNYLKEEINCFETNRNFVFANRVLGLKDCIIDEPETPLHFNDLLYSTSYKDPYYLAKKVSKTNGGVYPKIKIGSNVKCLTCGKNYITDSGAMECDECLYENDRLEDDSIIRCECCDRTTRRENSYYIESADSLICEDCYVSEVFECPICEGLYFNTDRRFSEKEELYICKYCYIKENDKEYGER
jgi:hypothetical protein